MVEVNLFSIFLLHPVHPCTSRRRPGLLRKSTLFRSVVPLRKPSRLLDRLLQPHGWRQGDPELHYDKRMLYSFDQLLDWIPLTTAVKQQHFSPNHEAAFVRGRRNKRESIYATTLRHLWRLVAQKQKKNLLRFVENVL